MAFPITSAPILVDASGSGHGSRQSSNEINPMGPFVNGSSQYIAFVNITALSLRTFKSSDDGATWNLQDDTGCPDKGSTGTPTYVFFDDVGKVIYYLYVQGTGPFMWRVVGFDTNTDTYGSPTSWRTPFGIFGGAVFIRQLSGDFVLFYSDSTTGDIWYIKLSGSTPSGPTMLHNLAHAKESVDSGGQDPTGLIHLSYSDQTLARYYIGVSSGLTISSGPILFDGSANDFGIRADFLLTSSGGMIFAWTADARRVFTARSDTRVLPLFLYSTVATYPAGGSIDYAALAETPAGLLQVSWVQTNFSGDPIIDETDYSTFDGVSWSAPALLYDEVANPPADGVDQFDQFIHTAQSKYLATGTFLYVTGLETQDPTGCTGFVLRDPTSTPPTSSTLQLNKTVVGGSKTAADFILTAVGNDSPATVVTGPGPQVGPTEVPNITFDLSEAFGPTWDGATGTWASNSSPWNGGYVASAWVCTGGGSMPNDHTIVFPTGGVGSGGGDGSVTLPPVLIDPTGFSRQTTSELNPMEFKVGENLYAFLISQVTSKFGIFKSTDGGATWVEKDAAGSPDSNASSAVLNGTIICVNAGGTLVEFDTGTDTYGTPGDSGGLSGPIYAQADGTYVALDAATGTHIRYSTYKFTDGFWVGPTNLLAGNLPLASVIGDSVDAGHVSYYDGTDLKYFRLSSTFVVGSQATLGVISGSQLRASSVIWGTKVAIGWADGSNIKVSIGTPLGGPTFSTSTVYARLSSDEDVSYPTLLVDKDGNLKTYFVVTNYNTDPFIDELRVSTSADGATWPTPTVFYDEIANPPADSVPDQAGQFIHTGDVKQLSSGRVVFITALETSDDGNAHCTGFALLADSGGGGGPSVNIVCTIVNTAPIPPVPPQPGSPCGGPVTPQPTTDVQFELRRVYASMKPAPRIPVRGS